VTLGDSTSANFGSLDFAGAAVSIKEGSSMELAASEATGGLSLEATGAITQSGAIDADSTATFTAGANGITLTNASNDFTGAVSLSNSGSNDVALTDANALDLGSVAVGQNLTVTTSGALTDSGAITVAGLAQVVSTGQSVTLGDSTSANFGSLDFTGAAVSIKEGSSMELAASEATGALSLEASGAITQSGAIDADSTATFTSGANAITLSHGSNDFTGAVSLSNSGSNDVALTDANALDLGTVGVGQNLTITTSGAISDSGVVTVAGTTTFDNSGGSSAAILLDSESTYTGNVSFTTDAGSDVTITDNSAFAIQSGLHVNNLSITSTGSVTDLGDIDIDGTLTVSAASQTIDLSGTGNDLTGAVTLTGAAVTLEDTTATSIAGISATGALSVTSSGAITQSGAIDADSTAGFTAGANAITLTNTSNDFSGAVSLSNSGSNDVALTDANALDLGSVAVGQNLTVTTGGALTDSGAITVGSLAQIVSTGQSVTLGDSTSANFGSLDFAGAAVSIKEGSSMELAASEATGALSLEASGAITQSGAIDADSTATFIAGANAITLSHASNDFTGAVSLSNSGSNNVTIDDSNNLEFGTISIATGDLNVDVAGTITQSAAISVGGNSVFDNADGSDAPITLSNESNVFTETVTFITDTGSDVSIVDTTLFDLVALSANNLTVTAGGAISDSGVLDLGGTASFTTTGGNGNVVLSQASDIDGALSVTTHGTGTTSVTNFTNGINLGTISTSALTVGSGGAITDSGIISVSGATILDNTAGSNAAILLDSESTYTGNVTFTTDTGSDVTITDNGAFAIQSGLHVNNLSITATGSVTDLGDIDIDGTLMISAASQTIDLSGTGNDLTGPVTLTGAAVTLVDTTATSIAGITATEALSVTSSGAITQSGAIDADSTAAFTAGANAITLTNTSNDFSGAVSLSNSGSNDVALIDVNALDLGTVTAGQNLTVTTGGALTDSGAITAPGLATIISTGSNVNLGDTTAANFGSVDFSGATVSIKEGSSMELAASEATGSLTLETTGAVSDSGTLAITGATTISASGQSVSLTNADSTFGDFTVNAKDVYIVESGSFSSTSITAETVQVSATEGVSVISTGDGLQLAAQSGTGNIDVVNTGGLVISELANVQGIQFTDASAAGKISLVAKSPLTVNAIIDAKAGEVLLVASGSNAADDVTINSNVIGQSVNVYAGDSIAIEADASINSPAFELNVGTNYDSSTSTASPGSSTAGLSLSSTAGLQSIKIPSIGIITGKGRVTEFSTTGITYLDDYFNALNPAFEEFVNLDELGATGSVESELYDFVDTENSGSIEIDEKK
jgi:hypothetical protein